MGSNNSKSRRAIRRAEAETRQSEYDTNPAIIDVEVLPVPEPSEGENNE